MSFASLRRVLRSARKGLCSTCSKTKHPQLEAAGAGHVGCLMYTFETLGQLMVDEHDVTALHVAARKGQISIIIYLIENDLVEGVPRAKNGATPAHDAAGTGNLECLKYILSRTKASALDKDANQATPLHWALQSGHFRVVQWLVVQANASIDSAANNGITPIHLAAAKNYLDILRWLTGHAYRNHPKPRRLINAKDKNGATPLYHAAHAGHLKVIQWLAEKGGGDPTIFTTQGLAPMHAATVSGHLACVSYLFRFGSATAPGGLRSTEGASALHYAAADGHIDIIKWLMDQKECTGNERDYYQCTPLHDAAEHGHLKAIQVLCDSGADHLLTDIEGNFPKDLAEKHHHSKCVKYLASRQKSKTAKMKNGSAKKDVPAGKGLRRQQNTTKAEMIDSYRNAPPHQRPVSLFEEEDDEEFDSVAGESQWETLHDLMDESELESLGPSDANTAVSTADRKRRNLKENMRREAEERQKKKKELLLREREYEKEIRDRLMEEEQLGGREWEGENKRGGKKGKKHRKSEVVNTVQHSDVRRLSLPAILTSEAITERGIVEKRTWEFESRSPVGTPVRSTFLSKFWPAKKSTNAPSGITASQSWDSATTSTTDYVSSSQDSLHVMDAGEDDLPVPPPLPTQEYLLGKRPPNLRGKGRSPRHKSGTDVKDADEEYSSDVDSDHSSTHSDRKSQQRKKSKKKKKKSSKEDDAFDWKYNKLTIPQSSPPRERKGMPRKLTPRLADSNLAYGGQKDLASAFDEVSQELERNLLLDSPSSLSPLHSPSPKSPISSPNQVSPSPSFNQIAGFINKSSGRTQPKRAAPVLPPHLQNKQGVPNGQPKPPDPQTKKTTPISLKGSSRKPAQRQQPGTAGSPPSPGAFMADLNQAIFSSSTPPRVMRQLVTPAGYQPSPINGIGVQPEWQRSSLEAERSESDSDSSEYTSSSDDTSSSEGSSTDDSSDEDSGLMKPQMPKRPIMARNIGMGRPRRGLGGINRARLMARYPRLLRKKVIRLPTIDEVPEEILHEAETSEKKARVFHRLVVEKRIMKAWRKYMQIMKTIYRKAEKMAQRRRRDLLAKVFYSWVQVRNLGAVEKTDIGRAITYHEKRLKIKVFTAWYSTRFGAKMPIARSTSMQLVSAEVSFIEWINEQLPQSQAVDNISESLADGTLILKAISAVTGKKAPKHNHHPKVQLHRQDNWKVAHEFMKSVKINVKGIEPADLGNVKPAAIHNMFTNILKWDENRLQTTVI